MNIFDWLFKKIFVRRTKFIVEIFAADCSCTHDVTVVVETTPFGDHYIVADGRRGEDVFVRTKRS